MKKPIGVNETENENERPEIAMAVADKLLQRARATNSVVNACALANDIYDMARYECDWNYTLVEQVLLQRIGGIRNLAKYVACLVIKPSNKPYFVA